MSLAPHLWRMLGLGTVEVVVEFHPPTSLAECGSRKMLARYCEERVAEGLAGALERPARDAGARRAAVRTALARRRLMPLLCDRMPRGTEADSDGMISPSPAIYLLTNCAS